MVTLHNYPSKACNLLKLLDWSQLRLLSHIDRK